MLPFPVTHTKEEYQRKEAKRAKSKEYRRKAEELAAILRDEREEEFDALPAETVDALIGELDEVTSTYETTVEQAEEAAYDEARVALEAVLEKYGYAVTKHYTETSNVGAYVNCKLDLDQEIDNL